MKKFITLLIAFTLGLFSQQPNLNWENTLEANSFGLTSLSGNKIIKTKDQSSYIIACTPNEAKPWLTKVSINGTLEWSIGRPKINGIIDVPIKQEAIAYSLSESEDFYIFNGIHKDNKPFFPLGKAFQFEISKEYITGGENIISDSPDDYLVNPTLIINNSFNNNLITVGYLARESNFSTIVYEVNRFSRIKREATLDTILGNFFMHRPLYIIPIEDDRFLLLIGNSFNAFNSTFDFYLQEFDNNFLTTRTVKIETTKMLANYIPMPKKLQKINNKTYVFGNFVNNGSSDTKPFIVVLNENMEVEKYKVVEQKALISSGFVDENGFVVIVGQKANFQENTTKSDFFISELNSMLDVLSNFSWSNDNYEYNTLHDLIDGGSDYIVTGRSGSDMYVASLKKTVSSIDMQNSVELLVVPNPSIDYISIKGLANFEANSTLIINDIYGKVVLTTNNVQDVFIGNLSNGVYTVRLENGGKTEILKLIKSN